MGGGIPRVDILVGGLLWVDMTVQDTSTRQTHETKCFK